MTTPTPEHDPGAPLGAASLLPALFEFAAMPGRFSIALREPRVAFDNIHSVLTLACGRKVDGVPLGNATDADVRRVARYFVRTAMLRPGADYYTLMGVQPGFAENTLREHYRLLMRLSHPDFATPGQPWPADAATRINQANDVLSSAVRRHEYDTTAAPASVIRPQAGVSAAAGMMMRRVPPEPRPSMFTRLVRQGGVLAGGLASLGGGAVRSLRGIPMRKMLGGMRAPRVRSSTSTVVFASVLAAAGGSVITALWMNGDGQDDVAQAASSSAVLPDALDGTAYGPTLRSTTELHLPDSWLGKPVVRKPAVNSAPDVEVVAAVPVPVQPAVQPVPEPALQLAPQAAVQPGVQAAAQPAPQRAGAGASAWGNRAPTAPTPPAARPEGAFQFSFTPPGSRVAEARTQRAPVEPVTRPESAFAARSAPAPMPAQAPEPQLNVAAAPAAAVAPTAPVAAPAPSQTSAPAAAPSAPAAAAPPKLMPKFSLADVQPTLANVIGAMQTGRAENVLQMVDASSRRSDNGAFSDAYNRTVSGAKAVQLGKVSLSSLPLDDQLVVDGTVQLMLVDGNSVTTQKDLYIRAWFVARAGNPVLTRLSASPVRQ